MDGPWCLFHMSDLEILQSGPRGLQSSGGPVHEMREVQGSWGLAAPYIILTFFLSRHPKRKLLPVRLLQRMVRHWKGGAA